MKIAVASDLHLEFGDIDLKNTEGAQVLILSGDIMIADKLKKQAPDNGAWGGEPAGLDARQDAGTRYRNFLLRCSKEFPYVIYVAGNHEFYNGKWFQTLDLLRDECAKYPNVHFLENDTIEIDDVTFIGGTLWTDMNKSDPLTLHAVRDMMSDFRVIRKEFDGYTNLKPIDTVDRHKKMLQYIDLVVAEKHDQKFVVVGHHSPSKLSTHARYINETVMNGAYSSDLSEFILDRPQIKLWTHGHTHHPFDYVIGETRVVCNPRGYEGYEPEASYFQLKFLDV